MWLVEVIPISKGIRKETLSYYTKTRTPEGSIISVPLRKKEVQAIVVGAKSVSSTKSRLRQESFSLKKVRDPKPGYFLSDVFFESARELSQNSLHSTGSVLYSLLPKIYLENIEKYISKRRIKQKGDVHEKFIIQTTEEERFNHYKSIIREQIAKKKSVVLLSPTTTLVDEFYKRISKGIEDYCVTLHSSQSKKISRENLELILKSKKPRILITTGKFLAIPLQNLGAIILDKENSSFYKGGRRPFVDFREFAEIFAEKTNTKIFFGDLYLRTETIWRSFEGELVPYISLKSNLDFKNQLTLVDMKSKKKPKNFKIVGKKLEDLIKKSLKEKSKIFLFVARRGLHPVTVCGDCGQTLPGCNPVTVCGDCGQTLLCERCSSPVVLHKSASENFFLCHKCGRSRSAGERCQKCNSWKLVPLGIGIEFLEKRLKERFKNIKMFRVDSDKTPTVSKTKKEIKNFEEKGGVLLGTEKAINFLNSVSYSGIVSMDSFFAIPDFRINEKILNLTLGIREKTEKEMVIQTRDIDQKILEFIKSGFVLDFYREDINERESFKFPPFVKFIKISFFGTKTGVFKEEKKIKEYFKEFDVKTYPSFVSKKKGKFMRNALIRINRDSHVTNRLREKILALPPQFSVDVNPDNLL